MSTQSAKRATLLAEFYDRVQKVAAANGAPRLRDCAGRDGWPDAGVYFFFEDGEPREDGKTPRVVRVGTHALTATSKTTLWTRLRAHRGSTGGRNPGAGNHRGSIFRLHVGTALINHGGFDVAAKTWGKGSSAPREVRECEVELEQAVSAHIGDMRVVVVDVPDRHDRSRLERECIALLSNYGRAPIDPPSARWLGAAADREAVRRSGLWNVNHVPDGAPSAPALELIR